MCVCTQLFFHSAQTSYTYEVVLYLAFGLNTILFWFKDYTYDRYATKKTTLVG